MPAPKILLVDDDQISLRILVDHCQSNQYSYQTAMSGEEAWQLLDKNPLDYHVVIVDRLMGAMTGVDLLIKIKADARLVNVPVIIQTGQATPEEFIAAISAGASDFLYKPVEQELLLYVVENVLNSTTRNDGELSESY